MPPARHSNNDSRRHRTWSERSQHARTRAIVPYERFQSPDVPDAPYDLIARYGWRLGGQTNYERFSHVYEERGFVMNSDPRGPDQPRQPLPYVHPAGTRIIDELYDPEEDEASDVILGLDREHSVYQPWGSYPWNRQEVRPTTPEPPLDLLKVTVSMGLTVCTNEVSEYSSEKNT